MVWLIGMEIYAKTRQITLKHPPPTHTHTHFRIFTIMCGRFHKQSCRVSKLLTFLLRSVDYGILCLGYSVYCLARVLTEDVRWAADGVFCTPHGLDGLGSGQAEGRLRTHGNDGVESITEWDYLCFPCSDWLVMFFGTNLQADCLHGNVSVWNLSLKTHLRK